MLKRIIKKYWYLILISLFCLTPVIWFIHHPGTLINGVDTNFPLDPLVWFQRRFFVWNNTLNAGSDFSSSTSGIFFHFIQVVSFLLRFGLQEVELISLLFWFSLMISASYYLARHLFPKNIPAQIVFVIFYCFNTYLFNTWENVKVSNIALMVSLPLFIANILVFQKGSIKLQTFLFRNLLGSILAMGTGINPAYFITLVGGVGIFSLNSRKAMKAFLLLLVELLLVNALWILPTANFLLFSDKQIVNLSDIGFTDWLNSLSKDSSLINVLRLQGAWDWYSFEPSTGAPLYLPYVVNFFRNPPFILFSFAIPAMAILSFLFKDRKKVSYYIIFSVFLVLGVFLGAGTHEPTGYIYQILVNKVPFFQFFRSPWYIFTPYLVLAYAGLIGLLFENLEVRFNRLLVLIITAVVVVGNLTYNYPLVTGKIFRPSRQDGFYVNFPDYVWQTGNYLNHITNFPRLIAYPDDNLESFTWGYKGVDSIISLFSNREIISSSSITQSNSLSALMKNFYDLLERGKYFSAKLMMPVLGADSIFYKKDTSSLSPYLNDDFEKVFDVKNIGQWSFLQADDLGYLKKITSPSYVYVTPSDITDTYGGVSTLLEQNSLVINSSDSVVPKIDNILPEFDSKKLLFYKGINTSYKNNPTSESQNYNIEVTHDSQYLIGVEDYGTNQQIKIQLGSSELFSPSGKTDNLYVFGPFKLIAGKYKVTVIFPKHPNLFTTTSFKDLSDTRVLRRVDLPEDLDKTLVAFNDSNKPKSIYLPISTFDPFLSYRLSFDYKYVYGSVPIFEIIQFNERSPIKNFSFYLGGSMDWEQKSEIIDPIETPSKITVQLTMPANFFKDRSKVLVENLVMKATYKNNLFVVEQATEKNKFENLPQINITSEKPTEYLVDVNGASGGYFLTFSDIYNSNWELYNLDNEISKPLHFTANGYSNGWYVPSGAHRLRIYYQPQSLFIIGFGISLLTSLAIFLLIIVNKVKKRNGKFV